ncbi:MAG: aldo/keto reductase [Rhizobiaceae bacterium]
MHLVQANGASIPAIGLGTWTLKGDECVDIVGHALKAGYRHLDTARMYDNERAVGEGLRASGVPRRDVFVTTKVWWTDIAPGDLERSAEGSLKRLAIDAVDLLLIHWPNSGVPLEDSIRALNAVRAAGMAKHVGVANFPTFLLAEAIGHSDAPLVCNQVEYHPYLPQNAVLGACRESGMAMVAYCPLYRQGGLLEEPSILAAARKHGRTPAQVVLRWHVQQENVVAIPRTTRLERLAENIAVFDFALGDEEMAAISALSSRRSRICDFDFSPRQWDRD